MTRKENEAEEGEHEGAGNGRGGARKKRVSAVVDLDQKGDPHHARREIRSPCGRGGKSP